MIRFTPLALTLALLPALALTSPALAEHHEGSHHGKRFEKADTNGDGFLTRAEMDAAHKEKLDRMFTKFDKDKDGKLSKAELEEGRKAMRERWQQKMQERRASGAAPATAPAQQ